MRRLVAVALTCALLFSTLAFLLPMGGGVAAAADRQVVLSTTYPSVTTGVGKDITFNITFDNRGTQDETLAINVAAPDGWKPSIQASGFLVRDVFVSAGKTQIETLTLTPPTTVQPGDYNVKVTAGSADGQINSSLDIKVGITSETIVGLKLDCQYPTLSGEPSAAYGFKADLVNQATEDRTVNLSATAPDGWQVTFAPSFETKQITSLGVKAGATQGLDISVTAPSSTAPGEYPVKIQASAGADKASVDLKITATGTGKMLFATVSGNLSTEAQAGSGTVLAAVVQNTGSADLQGISLAATTPDGWKVTFDPAKIADLKPGAIQQVNVNIQPADKTIAGDYMVNMSATAGTVTQTLDIRTSVTTSTIWGAAGVIIVGIVIVGMVGLYTRLGRR
jgi:uncharacterized membrane protein